jgi:HEPN domain-containing protein
MRVVDWHGYVFLAKNRRVVQSKPGQMVFPGPFLTKELRTQLTHVLLDAVGSGQWAQEAWGLVVDHFDREMGTRDLGVLYAQVPQQAVEHFLAVTDDVADLDLTALGLIVAEEISNRLSSSDIGLLNVRISPVEAVETVNRFLREANVRYQFERYRWVDVSSGYVHEQVIRPALDALDRDGFAGALEEFKSALDHARAGRTKEAATEATKSLESTIKCVCNEHGWSYPEGATAQPLFRLMVEHGLFEDWMEGGFMGVVVIRNKATAHGQGPEPRPLPPHLAQLAVNLAASHIIALVAASDAA